VNSEAPTAARSSFTLVELLVIVATLIVVALVLVPALVDHRRLVGTKACQYNLKQVGLAFRTSALGHEDNPTLVSTNQGGTMELVDSGQVFVHFRAISNELGAPKLLVCPMDKSKVAAAGFFAGFCDSNVSYFIGADATDTDPKMFLSGDRNLASNGSEVGPGLLLLTTNTALSWTRAIHNKCGNTAFADGSVQFVDSAQLNAAARSQGNPTSRLVIP
jgi:prepilin-type processing-associated H-X9-DG protein